MRFEDLDVRKRAARLSTAVYQQLTNCRDFGFKDQITRSALSIASNIAEGYERATYRDGIKFLTYAKGSSGEFRTQVYVGMEAGFIDPEVGRHWVAESKAISMMLYRLIESFSA